MSSQNNNFQDVQNLSFKSSADSYKDFIPVVEQYAKAWMNRNDSSHDYSHAHRVAIRAINIARQEQVLNPLMRYNLDLIYICGLVHDIADRKYVNNGQPSLIKDHNLRVKPLTEHLRKGMGFQNETMIQAIDTICHYVSYNIEKQEPEAVQAALLKYPELGIVQDSDRIDAVGAIGISRAFAFGNVVELEGGRGRSLRDTLDHFDEKLTKLDKFAKTNTGRLMLKHGIVKLQLYKTWYEEELNTDQILS